jgi:hypothetical protein
VTDKEIRNILDERKETHGSFTENAEISQGLQSVVAMGSKWYNMSAVQKEAIRVICAKIARICTGDPNHKDSWDDIAGYAILAADRIEEKYR